MAALVLIAILLVSPAGAVFTMEPVTGIFRVGDVVAFSGINTDNTSTFIFVTGPFLDDNGVMLTNTSRTVDGGHIDSAPVAANYSWSFSWNTSLSGVNLNDGIYVVFATTTPLSRNSLAGHLYQQQSIYFQGRLSPVTTATTAAPTPVPTWTPPPAGTEVQVSSAASDDYPGRFDGDLIVYEADRGDGNSDIYLYNITSGKTTAVATGPGVRSSPAISRNTIVYSAYEKGPINRTDADLFFYNIDSGMTTRLTLPGDQLNPRISGHIVAWQDEAPGRSSINVMLYDLDNLARLKVPAAGRAYSPDISGGRVIWVDDLLTPAVFFYDIGGETVRRITNRTGIKDTPAISGNHITWADTRNDFAEIYALDLDTGAETQVTSDDTNHFTPAISGELVAWVDFRNGNRDIYLYDLAAGREMAVTTSEGQQVAPQIGGCTIAWADDRNGSFDVYYERIPGCTPPPEPAAVSLQPEATPTPVQVVTQSTTVTTRPTVRTFTPIPVPTTTKSPGFGIFPALGALAALAILMLRKHSR
jgi:TolB protein